MYLTSLDFSDSQKLPDVFDAKQLKMVSGYDLLDKLSRRRQYMKSNVREKTSLSENFNSVQVPEPEPRSYTTFDLKIDTNDEDIQVDGLGLMDRTSLDTRRSRSTPWFEDNRSTYKHHAEYLKRLSNLREELISQEQTHLANALDRLRMRHNGKENSPAKQKFRELTAEGYPRRTLLTTSEQFQRMRPKKLPPHISPLEGKQLLEPQTFRSLRSPPSVLSPVSNTPRSFEEKFRVNLQKIIQPTSSIPNIGRKSTGQSKELVLESSPIQKSRNSKLAKEESIQSQETNPFKAVHKGNGPRLRSLVRPDSDELDLSPQAIKFENLSDKDKISLEKLKEYYCIYYLPNTSPVSPEEEDNMAPPGGGCDAISSVEKEGFDSQKKKRISLLEGKSIFPTAVDNIPSPRKRERDSFRTRHTKSHDSIEPHSRQTRSHDNMESNSLNSSKTVTPSNSRRQIVVDMPSIVFNSATPDKNENELLQHQNAVLSKTVKQNELRQKELKNLIEDVKEINKRTDQLSERMPETTNDED